MLIHILTPGFTTPNSQGFLLPLLRHRDALKEAGVKLRVYRQAQADAADCDVLMIDSKFYRPWLRTNLERVVEQLSQLRKGAQRIFWFDTSDSAGTLQTGVLPYVDRYFKGQLLKDRSLYQQALYGGRLFTHYLHHELNVHDESPTYLNPILSKDDLSKLSLSWNYGLANLSLEGPAFSSLYQWLGWPVFLRTPARWDAPSASRPLDFNCRFSASYPKATIRFQRASIQKLFRHKETDRVNRYSYFSELRQSKIVLSPFGWGEINLRDFEAIVCGCLLIKPDISHLEAWPNIFEAGVTILTHDWSCRDVLEVVENALVSYAEHLTIARVAQERYQHSFREDVFLEMLLGLLNDSRPTRADTTNACLSGNQISGGSYVEH
ncbi:MAG: glycosyltransferase family 1 protein [Elusimicrobia bacterium]|nr:glycosyltransferase family 1 protein [Elusimicrobiota bacterium]